MASFSSSPSEKVLSRIARLQSHISGTRESEVLKAEAESEVLKAEATAWVMKNIETHPDV